MKVKTELYKLWAGLDRLLLVAVFVLLGVVWYASNRAETARVLPKDGSAVRRTEGLSRPAAIAKVVNGIRVSAGRTRMNSIARSMVASGWEQLPSCPAMDMREDGKTYEILFSLPAEVTRESVRVMASGNVLTLTMKSGVTGKTSLQRVRIPCGVEHDSNIQSVVSNDVLRVRILSAGG